MKCRSGITNSVRVSSFSFSNHCGSSGCGGEEVKTFDAAVVGLGTMGTFVCREFARRRVSVIGFDQFDPPHDRGSHTGDTRVFRTAYAEHPDYVPLAQRAGALWDQLSAEEGTTFLHRTGMLSIGERDSLLIAGTRASAAAHNLPLESLSR